MSESTAVLTGSHTRLGQSLLIDQRSPGGSGPTGSPRKSLHQLGGGSVGLGMGAQTSRPVRQMRDDRGLSPDSVVAASWLGDTEMHVGYEGLPKRQCFGVPHPA